MSKVWCSIPALLILAPSLAIHGQASAKKGEAATGTVTGTVTCADTNAPARFAVVTLERVPPEGTGPIKKMPDGDLMNSTATTDLDGRFVIEKVPVGRYFVVGLLPGYMGPLSRFDREDLAKMSDETLKAILKTVPTVSVEPNQVAQSNLRLDHASELSGTVLYDDGSPAIHLFIHLLRKDKNGEITAADGILISGAGLFGAETMTDDRGRYAIIGVSPGEYVVSVSMKLDKVALGGILSGGLSINLLGSGSGEVKIFSGSKFRLKDAKLIEVGEGEQLGGLDITIPLAGLHQVRGVVTAKRDGHPLNKGQVALMYADDRKPVQSADLDREGNFEFPYVPEDRYILRATGGEDTELIQKHEFNSNFTEEKMLRSYGEVEMPLTVQADMSSLELAAPDAPVAKAAAQ
jgi:hypothetical protein